MRMRPLFLVLLLANLGLFAYAYLVRQSSGPERQIPLLQMNPEKIQPLKATAVPSAKAKPDAARPVPTACVEWGVFAGPDVARADAAMATLELPAPQVVRTITDAAGYWVYIPPLKTKAEADKKVGELKALGIPDFFVVQDAGNWRFAISLGIFRTEDGAKTFLGGLRDKGVRSAIIERRENFLKQVAYFVKEPAPDVVAKIAVLQRDFPGSEVKAVTCPAGGDEKS